MATQQHHMEGMVDQVPFAQGVQVLGKREDKGDLHQLRGLEGPAADGDPGPGVHAAAALDLFAEQRRVDHEEYGKARQQVPEIGKLHVVQQREEDGARHTKANGEHLGFKIPGPGGAVHAAQKQQAVHRNSSQQQPQEDVRLFNVVENAFDTSFYHSEILLFIK